MAGRFSSFLRFLLGNFGVILGTYPGVRAITVACVAAYLVQSVAWNIEVFDGIALGAILDRAFGMFWPFARQGAIWQPVTHAFLHGSLWHLVLNLFSLIFFGYAVERILGTRRFWLVFLASAAIGGIGWMAFDCVEPRLWYAVSRLGGAGLRLAQRWGEAQSPGLGNNVCVGASGGVFGLIGAFAALCPRERLTVLLFYVVPVTLQTRHLALLLVAVNVVEMVGSMGHVAYMAHLLGGLAGYVYAKALIRRAARFAG